MQTTTESIAAKVRGVAAEKRFTQQRIATTLSLSRTAIVERYGARVAWTAPELFTLADVMRVDIARFFPERQTQDAA